MLNLTPLLSTLSIKTKDLEVIPLDLTTTSEFGWAQREFVREVERQYNAGKPVRIITLKARQVGLSTITEAILYLWGFIHHGTSSLVLTHENKQSVELFQMTKLFWETWPFRNAYELKYQTKQTMDWHETRSRMQVGTAGNPNSFRGSTFHAAHLSEVAFYRDPETLFTGLNATIPERHPSFMVLESTANGVGNWFYQEWQKAEEGDSAFVPLFFPWYKHYEYRLPTTICSPLELDADEKHLLELGGTYENVAWRRQKLRSLDLQMFNQEWPAEPADAFIATGSPVFSSRHLSECYLPAKGIRGRLHDDPRGRSDRVRFVKDPSGPLTVFKAPKPGDRRSDRYFVAADPSRTTEGDPACVQVINRQTGEQVAVWHGKINPGHLAYEILRLGEFYNHCSVCTEIEGGGQQTIFALLNSGYGNVWMDRRPDRIRQGNVVAGWSTNFQRKRWAISMLQRMILDKSITIHDPKTYHQLLNYVVLDNGELGNSDNSDNDDAVMALAICVTASATEAPMAADRVEVTPDIYNVELELA